MRVWDAGSGWPCSWLLLWFDCRLVCVRSEGFATICKPADSTTHFTTRLGGIAGNFPGRQIDSFYLD